MGSKLVCPDHLALVPSNADPSLLTLRINTELLTGLAIGVDIVQAAATAITCTARARCRYGGGWYKLQTMSVAGGVGGLDDFYWAKSITGNDNGMIDLPCGAYAEVELVFAAVGGGANDLISAEVSGLRF